jgi:hypothetical protein
MTLESNISWTKKMKKGVGRETRPTAIGTIALPNSSDFAPLPDGHRRGLYWRGAKQG